MTTYEAHTKKKWVQLEKIEESSRKERTDVLGLTRLVATEFLDDGEGSRMDLGSTITHDTDDDLSRRRKGSVTKNRERERDGSKTRERDEEREQTHLLPTSVRPSLASRLCAEVVDILHYSSKSSKEELVVLL